jgi:hypothetical protein
VQGDPLLRRYFSVFLFEDLPASDRRADEVYLKEVDRSDVYVGLFGREYGAADGNAPSPTEREFDRATAKGKTRLIFVKGSDDKGRDPRMLQLIRRAGDELIRRRFQGVTDFSKELLTEAVVNAVAHRDYDSNASVQVMLFSDRLEVWNPGELPPSLTFDDLRGPHASIPRNPLLAEPLFLTR